MKSPAYSVVVPVFNEIAALPKLVAELTETMESLGRDYECIFVDDGSTDGTGDLLDALERESGLHLRSVHFRTNLGQGAALYTGLREALGPVVITMDGDGQSCPADIPALLEALEDGSSDLICGVRKSRQDSLLRRWMSKLANAVRSKLLADGTRDSGCALKVMRREVVPSLLPLKTLYSFIPALAIAAGFRVAERPVSHRRRVGGQSSYGLRAFLWWPLIDMLGVRWYQGRRVRDAAVRDELRYRPENPTGSPRRASLPVSRSIGL